ncbi:MAG: FecR domain-containing protein, partial [Deltaproteobacteria bacterium]|nr:FecR domain-containing protein [Deltaproteobacteria bacterium]
MRIYKTIGTNVLLNVDDQVHTAKNSTARVILSSGDEVVTLRSNTVFRVEDQNEAESNTRLLTGDLTFEVNPNRTLVNDRKREFKIRTISAVVGVRGSEGDVFFESDTGATIVVSEEGDIYIIPPEFEGDEDAIIVIPAGSSAKMTEESIRLPGSDKEIAKKDAIVQTRKKNQQEREKQAEKKTAEKKTAEKKTAEKKTAEKKT